MKSRLGTFLAVTLLAAGCSGGDKNDPILVPDGSTAAATGGAPRVTVLRATVDTTKSGCDAKANGPGDCWLPLYPRPALNGTPLNKGGSCTAKNQAKCWPQPGDRVDVLCLFTTPDGTLWYGVDVPAERVAAAPTAKATGYTSVSWLRLDGQAAQLPECEPVA